MEDSEYQSVTQGNHVSNLLMNRTNYNNSETLEDVMLFLESLAFLNNGLTSISKYKILLRQDHSSLINKVKIISGGPAGMAPLNSGFVGPGMLTAAVFGDASNGPTFFSVLAALRILGKNHKPGVLVIAMNNLADRLTFSLACQQAALEGIKVMCVTIGEDCSGKGVSKVIGRRGLCGILFLQKIAGAMAEENRTLFEIYYVLTALNGGALGTINIEIPENKNHPKLSSRKDDNFKLNSVPNIVNKALYYILQPDAPYSLHIGKDEKVAVIVNNLGRLTDFQLAIVTREVCVQIRAKEINIVNLLSGRFLTSSDTQAFSISVLKITETLLRWLEFPVKVKNWSNNINNLSEIQIFLNDEVSSNIKNTSKKSFTPEGDSCTIFEKRNLGPKFSLDETKQVIKVLTQIIKTISGLEEHLNKLDYDQNYGSTLKKLMVSLKYEMDQKTLMIITPFGLLSHLAELSATSMAGIAGAVFSILFCSSAQSFVASSSHVPVCWCMWMEAAASARNAFCAFTKAELGDNTVYDALHPFVETFATSTFYSFNAAVEAAMKGMEEAACHHPEGKPDPGAFVLAVSLRTILNELQTYLREEDMFSPYQSL